MLYFCRKQRSPLLLMMLTRFGKTAEMMEFYLEKVVSMAM